MGCSPGKCKELDAAEHSTSLLRMRLRLTASYSAGRQLKPRYSSIHFLVSGIAMKLSTFINGVFFMSMPKLFLSMQNIFRSKPFDIIVHGYKSESLQINMYDYTSAGLRRWLSSKQSAWNARVTRFGFNPWVRKIPCRRA